MSNKNSGPGKSSGDPATVFRQMKSDLNNKIFPHLLRSLAEGSGKELEHRVVAGLARSRQTGKLSYSVRQQLSPFPGKSVLELAFVGGSDDVLSASVRSLVLDLRRKSTVVAVLARVGVS